MNNTFFEWFVGLSTPGNIAYFVAGFVSSIICRIVYCKIKHRRPYLPWNHIGIAVGVCAIIIVSLQSSQAYSVAQTTAQEVQDCQIQFNTALRERAKITTENDETSQEQRKIIFEWIHDLIFPPPPYNTMATDDPERQQYGVNRTVETEIIFRHSIAKQEQLQKDRENHQFPDPTCGR